MGEPTTQWVGPLHGRGSLRALIRISIVLPLLAILVAEASHAHEDEHGPEAECGLCLLAKTPDHTAASHESSLADLTLLSAPAAANPRLAPTALHVLSHRSRAPPSLSL